MEIKKSILKNTCLAIALEDPSYCDGECFREPLAIKFKDPTILDKRTIELNKLLKVSDEEITTIRQNLEKDWNSCNSTYKFSWFSDSDLQRGYDRKTRFKDGEEFGKIVECYHKEERTGETCYRSRESGEMECNEVKWNSNYCKVSTPSSEACIKKDPSICQKLPEPTRPLERTKSVCFTKVAQMKRDVSICENIDDKWYYDCLLNVALATKDIDICYNMPSELMLKWDDTIRNYCFYDFATNNIRHVVSQINTHRAVLGTFE